MVGVGVKGFGGVINDAEIEPSGESSLLHKIQRLSGDVEGLAHGSTGNAVDFAEISDVCTDVFLVIWSHINTSQYFQVLQNKNTTKA